MQIKLFFKRIFVLVDITIVLAAILLTVVLIEGWDAFGQTPTELYQKEHFKRSEQWQQKQFKSPWPVEAPALNYVKYLFGDIGNTRIGEMVKTEKLPSHPYDVKPAKGLRVSWLGHSSILLQIENANFLVDPFWSDRSSPVTFMGPKRRYEAPISFDDLPVIDAVIISHDHYEQLDYATIKRMEKWKNTFVVPLGVGAHLRSWGIDEGRIIEMDWWSSAIINGINIVATPARHSSGRKGFIEQNKSLWSGYSFSGKKRKVWYSGDSGFFDELYTIGEQLGPFDMAIVDVVTGPNSWPNWHMTAAQAVEATKLVGGERMLGVHGWADFQDELLEQAKQEGVEIMTPKLGQALEF